MVNWFQGSHATPDTHRTGSSANSSQRIHHGSAKLWRVILMMSSLFYVPKIIFTVYIYDIYIYTWYKYHRYLYLQYIIFTVYIYIYILYNYIYIYIYYSKYLLYTSSHSLRKFSSSIKTWPLQHICCTTRPCVQKSKASLLQTNDFRALTNGDTKDLWIPKFSIQMRRLFKKSCCWCLCSFRGT